MIQQVNIPWETRADLLSVTSSEVSGHPTHVVKDLVKNEFFNFEEFDFFILDQLRQPITLAQLKTAVDERFNEQLSDSELAEYVQRLASDNLLIARKLGDGQRLYAQHQRQQSGALSRILAGLLSFRLPGIYPGPVLKALRPLGWTFFNSVSLLAFLIFLLGTLLFAVLSTRTMAEKIPTLMEMISPDHLFMMLLGFIGAKVLHELGHALACQHTGHECSEMGVMLLVFTPCLYCDVSDMWTEKSRWKRIFVSLAGVYVELAIAAACFWGWYFTVDGRLNQFFFGMMMITSINTLFINGNPLMRYDGYYALSDLMGIPNLAARSKTHLTGLLRGYFTHQAPEIQREPNAFFLTSYGLGSFLYRWLIMFAIGWGIWIFFDQLQLQAFGRIVVLLVLLSSIIPIIMSIRQSFRTVVAFGLRLGNVMTLLAVTGVVVFCVFKIEFSYRIWGTAHMQLSQSIQFFAPIDGFLHPKVSDQAVVKSNQLIAHLENDDLALERISLQGQIQEVDNRLDSLNLMEDSQVFASEIEFWKKRKLSLAAKYSDLELREKLLEIRSPSPGRFVALKHPPVSPDQERLSSIAGSVFDASNQGCFVRRGQVLGSIGDPDHLTGYLEIEEQDIELIKPGQTVRLFTTNATRTIEGQVTKISLEGHQSSVFDQARAPDNVSQQKPWYYIVEFQLDACSNIRVGSIQQAVVLGRPTTLAQYLQRWWKTSVWY